MGECWASWDCKLVLVLQWPEPKVEEDLKLDKIQQFVLDECDKCLDKVDMRKEPRPCRLCCFFCIIGHLNSSQLMPKLLFVEPQEDVQQIFMETPKKKQASFISQVWDGLEMKHSLRSGQVREASGTEVSGFGFYDFVRDRAT